MYELMDFAVVCLIQLYDLKYQSISDLLFSDLKLIQIIYIANKLICRFYIFVGMLFCLPFLKSSNSLQITHCLYHKIILSSHFTSSSLWKADLPALKTTRKPQSSLYSHYTQFYLLYF